MALAGESEKIDKADLERLEGDPSQSIPAIQIYIGDQEVTEILRTEFERELSK